jgi:hypothetical protein
MKSREQMLPVLLRLAERTPDGINDRELKIGLAMTFGHLKAEETIPFLVRNVTLERWPPRPNIWLKSQSAVYEHLPALAALVAIGPKAARAMMAHCEGPTTLDERLAAILIVTKTDDSPAAKQFLSGLLAEANMQQAWAQKSLEGAK